MSVEYVLGAIAALVIVVYLVYALINPDRF
jgi:K+-transporting ATPase KdpF subunit